jgi:hypothetical protein
MGNGQLIVPGTAVPADVRASKKFSSGTYYGAQGSMTEYSGTKYTPTAAGILIPVGYHDGTTGTVAEPNLIAANIKSGVSIFGITGTATGLSANGTGTSSSAYLTFTVDGGSGSQNYVTVSGLTFQPKRIFVWTTTGTIHTVYNVDAPTYPILMFQGGSTSSHRASVDGTSAFVTSTGFQLPCLSGSSAVTWEAYA